MSEIEAEPATKTLVGIFEVERLGVKKWAVTNTRYTYNYVTYGTWEEVHDALMEQTEAWERRLGGKGHGDGWRGKFQAERARHDHEKREKEKEEERKALEGDV